MSHHQGRGGRLAHVSIAQLLAPMIADKLECEKEEPELDIQ